MTKFVGATLERAAGAGSAQLLALSGARRVLFIGDSITEGTGASSSSLRFSTQATRIAGTAFAREKTNGGDGGARSDELIAALPGQLDDGIDHVHIAVGTNDASQDVALATFQANIETLVDMCKAWGATVSMSLVPPRGISGSGAADATAFTEAYNHWLWAWCPRMGIAIADTWSATVDPATGYIQAALVDGDHLHPNNAGHLALARAVAPALIKGHLLPPSPVTAVSSIGLVSNPLMSSTTGWTDQGGTASAGTRSVVAANPLTDRVLLTAGQWLTWRVDNSAGGSAVNRQVAATLDASKYSANDVLMVHAKVWHNDLTGASSAKLQVTNNAVAYAIPLDTVSSVGDPGPVAVSFSAPASPNTVRLGLSLTAAIATDVTAYLGQCQVYNLTTGGLVGIL